MFINLFKLIYKDENKYKSFSERKKKNQGQHKCSPVIISVLIIIMYYMKYKPD